MVFQSGQGVKPHQTRHEQGKIPVHRTGLVFQVFYIQMNHCRYLEPAKYIDGASIGGDGNVVMVLDVAALCTDAPAMPKAGRG